ncbi:unnamed protein product [Effrenium voratum]|nr:unnamed protein product [Effrenium voratum]
MAVERRGLGLAGWAATFVPCMSQALMPDMMIESRRQVKKRTNATAGRGALVVNSQELAHADFDTQGRSQGTALLQSAYSTQPLMAAQFDPMTGIQMPPQQPQMPLGVMPSAKALRWSRRGRSGIPGKEYVFLQILPWFLQPTSLQVPSMSAMQMQPDLTPSDGNLRGMAMPQIPALAPMYQPYQPYQPSWLYPSWQMQPQNFYRQDLVLQEQLSSMNKELQSLKQQEQKEAKDLELKATEVGVAEKHLREAEQKMKDADVAAKQLQDREQNVEDQAISAVRTAKTQVAQAQKEVKDMQDELRQAQADAIQARAAQAAAEEQVAKSEMLQAAQASDKQLGWMSQ